MIAVFRRQAAWSGAIILVASVILVYWPVHRFEFVNFDDDTFIYNNPHVRDGLTWEGMKWLLQADLTFDSENSDFWIPLTFLSHQITASIFGLDSGGHHAVNVLLHIINTLLLYFLLYRLTGYLGPSIFVAALFAIHPLHVESVAWITERKDLLSTFFGFIALHAYIKYVRAPTRSQYLMVVLGLVLSLMAKPMLVTLPVLLLFLDFWPLQRFSSPKMNGLSKLHIMRKLVIEKIPMLALVLCFSVITYMAPRRAGTMVSLGEYPFSMRIENAIVSYVRYIRKMIWPSDLAVFYPYQDDSYPLGVVLLALTVLIGISILAFRLKRTAPYLVTGWLWYLSALLPVIGLVQGGNQALADRYTYVPMIGLYIIIVWGSRDLASKLKIHPGLLVFLGSSLVSIYLVIAMAQVRHWENSITLFDHALRVTGKNYLAHNNLAYALLKERKIHMAIGHLTEVERIGSESRRKGGVLRNFLPDPDRLSGVIQGLQGVSKLEPGSVEFHNALGIVYYNDLRHTEDAIQEFESAVRIEPNNAEAHNNLGLVYRDLNLLDKAVQEFKTAITARQDIAEVYYNLAETYQQQGRLREAVMEYERALEINPSYREARQSLDSIPRL